MSRRRCWRDWRALGCAALYLAVGILLGHQDWRWIAVQRRCDGLERRVQALERREWVLDATPAVRP